MTQTVFLFRDDYVFLEGLQPGNHPWARRVTLAVGISDPGILPPDQVKASGPAGPPACQRQSGLLPLFPWLVLVQEAKRCSFPFNTGQGSLLRFACNRKMSPHSIMGTPPKAPEIRRLGEHLFLVRSAAQGCYLPQFQEALLGEYLKYYKCCFSGVHALRVP